MFVKSEAKDVQVDPVEADFNLDFGKSEFRGKKGFGIEMRRWMVQFIALSIKNWKVLFRKQMYVLIFLLLPSAIILTFLSERSPYRTTTADINQPAVDANTMAGCNVYYQSECIRVIYSPQTSMTDAVMAEVATQQGFDFGSDVVGFGDTFSAQEYVASNLGKVEYTVFFRNESNPLWTNDQYSETASSGSTTDTTDISSYVIFYNETIAWDDARSSKYNLNFQLLALQKSIESAFLKQVHGAGYNQYALQYGQFWNTTTTIAFDDDDFAGYTAAQMATAETNKHCMDTTYRNIETVGFLLPYVGTFSMILMSVIAYRLLGEERQKNLFGFLRRLGLMDSAYWASWFVSFQVLQLTACSIAMVVMAGIRSQNDYYSPSNAIQKIDYSVMFLVLWAGTTCFVSSAFFMTAISTSSNVANAISFAQFFVAIITIFSCMTPLNTYTAVGYTGGSILNFDCYFVTSSYNIIYSTKGLQGATFVQFMVFFMPWFHLSQALTDMLSIVQYDNAEMSVSLTKNFKVPPTTLSYQAVDGVTFTTNWIQDSVLYMLYASLIFVAISWFLCQAFSTDGSEGRPILSILVPSFVRKYLADGGEVVEEGDIRGEEKNLSAQQGSVRGYKLSKSYAGGVQALREVSFDMKRGEVFVLLGHNGAGKSTLINILTGLTSPTRGKTFLSGLDIDEDVADVQQLIGVCPQHDILWEDLTAMDHMLLVAAFKGLSGDNLFAPLFTNADTPEAAQSSPLFKSIQTILKQVQLLGRSRDFASSYSGGMRRRLSVALSAVGDVDVIFFDEPTTGLDPLSRRRVWETINILKRDRVVLLTTHNMEEADALGDNIMVLHNGQVKATGDSLTLKNLYGHGYQVQVEVHVHHVVEFLELMAKLLPGSQVKHDALVNPGICTISVGRGDVRSLPRLFAWLEGSKVSVAMVKEWAVSNTTLEQVFLTLCMQNNQVNFNGADASAALEVQQLKMCPMCGARPREAIIMRRFGGKGTTKSEVMALPDSVCRQCSLENDFYTVSESDAAEALGDPSGTMMSTLVERAQVAANNAVEEQTESHSAALALLESAERRISNSVHSPITAGLDVGDKEENGDRNKIGGESRPGVGAAPAVAPMDSIIDEGPPAALVGGTETAGGASGDSEKQEGVQMSLQRQSLGQPPPSVHPLARRGFEKKLPPVGDPRGQREGRGMSRKQRDVAANALATYGSEFKGSAGSEVEQMMAIFIKNTRLQGKQRCTNCCSICYIALMFLFLYAMSLIIGSVTIDWQQCPAGYVSAVGCEVPDLVDFLFYPSAQAFIVEGLPDIDFTVYGSNDDGYAIRTYMVPAEYSNIDTTSPFELYGVNVVDYAYPNAGLPLQQQGRSNILWSSLVSTTNDDLFDTNGTTGFGFKIREPPSTVASSSSFDAPNTAQMATQTSAFNTLSSSDSQCLYYVDANYDIGSTSTPDWRAQELFGATYCDVAIQCPTCVPNAVDINASYNSVIARTIDFNGTLWVGKNSDPTEYDSGYLATCMDISCFAYGYAFLNYQDTDISSGAQYLYDDSCPTGYGYYSKSPLNEVDQTQVATTYVNLLTNSLKDPFLRNFTIQGAYSPYGVPIMNGYIISQTQSFFLIFFSMVIMNGFWPLAVWRLGHEQSLDLIEFVRAMGMRPWVYIVSMFLYDCLIALVTGEVLMGFAVGLELLNFKDAPMGYLTAVVICSAVAFNGATLLVTKFAGRRAGVMSLVAVCLTLVMAIVSAILCNMQYPDEGSWPIELSIVPFLAQARSLYIILVYHRSSYEADVSLALMFVFGFCCLMITILIAEQEQVTSFIAEKAGMDEDGSSDDILQLIMAPDNNEKDINHGTTANEGDDSAVHAKKKQEADVAAEKERARRYIRSLLIDGQESSGGGSGAMSSQQLLLQVEEGAAGSDGTTHSSGNNSNGSGSDNSRLVTTLFNMKHKYVEASLAGLVQELLGHVCFPAAPTGEGGTTPAGEDGGQWAVRGLSLALSLGECFGLLGPNGAGKSTTISILIGRIKATLGKQYVAGVDLRNGLSSIHQFIGICPQFDITWPDLTVEEHLSFQARQRGIAPASIKAKVQQAATAVHLDGDAFNTKAAGLSGGMRRRLTIAMAIIGRPPIILMDEPTTGLDPENKQHVWKIIQGLKSQHRLILLTTHSMEEAEALCTRIGIMAKGTLRCIGTSQHLKSQFAKGYTLTVNSLTNAAEQTAITDAFVINDVGRGRASVLSRINCTTRYLINKTEGGAGVSEIFTKLEAGKARLQIREWGLAMTTLEEVFVSAVSESEDDPPPS
jgi:ABC-type multidrug transport system ATPase subunit